MSSSGRFYPEPIKGQLSQVIRGGLLELMELGYTEAESFAITIITAPSDSGKSILLEQYSARIREKQKLRSQIILNGAHMSTDALLSKLEHCIDSLDEVTDPLILIDNAPDLNDDQADKLLEILKSEHCVAAEIVIACLPSAFAYRSIFPEALLITGKQLAIASSESELWVHHIQTELTPEILTITNGVPSLVSSLRLNEDNPEVASLILLRKAERMYLNILKENLLDEMLEAIRVMILLGSGNVSELNTLGVVIRNDSLRFIYNNFPIFGLDNDLQSFSCSPWAVQSDSTLLNEIQNDNSALTERVMSYLAQHNSLSRSLALARALGSKPLSIAKLVAKSPVEAVNTEGAVRLLEIMRSYKGLPTELPSGFIFALSINTLITGDISLSRTYLKILENQNAQPHANQYYRELLWFVGFDAHLAQRVHEEELRDELNESDPLIKAFGHALKNTHHLNHFWSLASSEIYKGAITSDLLLHVYSLLCIAHGIPSRVLSDLSMRVPKKSPDLLLDALLAADLAVVQALCSIEKESASAALSDFEKLHIAISRLTGSHDSPEYFLYKGVLHLINMEPDKAVKELGLSLRVLRARDYNNASLLVEIFIAIAEIQSRRFAEAAIRLSRTIELARRSEAFQAEELGLLMLLIAAFKLNELGLYEEQLSKLQERSHQNQALHQQVKIIDAWLNGQGDKVEECKSHLSSADGSHLARLLERVTGKNLAPWIVSEHKEEYRNENTDSDKARPLSPSNFHLASKEIPFLEEKPLYIRLFGGFEVRLNDEIISERSWGKRKSKYLLALIAADENLEMLRSDIMKSLWPNLDFSRARNNLYSTTSLLKRALRHNERGRDFIIVSSSYMRLNPQLVASDVSLLLGIARLILSGNSGLTPAAELELCQLATEIYSHDLYAPDFELSDIFAQKAEECKQKYLDIIAYAIRLALEQDMPDLALWFEREVSNIYTHRGDVYYWRMQALAKNGQQARAITLYLEHAEALRENLGIEPNAQTEQLYRSLLDE